MFNLAETVETVTIVEAAELCGRHHDTVKRRVERRDFPGAFQGNDRNRTWHIPLDDLIASGMGAAVGLVDFMTCPPVWLPTYTED
jgi:hypothetical protein